MELRNLEIEKLTKLMEEMANTSKEEMGKRQPGETCAYERWNASDAPMQFLDH